MKSKLIIFFLTISIGMSKSNDGPSLTTTKWISEGSPKNEVWFQDWSGYMRLFVTTFSDTSALAEGPAAMPRVAMLRCGQKFRISGTLSALEP